MDTNIAAKKRGGQPRKRRWRIFGLPVSLVLALGLPVVFAIAMGVYDVRVQRELDALEDAIRAKGEPLTREDLDASYDAGLRSQPGAAAYLEALELLAQINEEEDQERRVISTLSISSTAGFGRFNQTEMANACAFVERRTPVLAAAAKALYGTAGDLPTTALRRDFTAGQFYRLRRLLETRGLIALEERDWDTFAQVQQQIIDVGRFGRGVNGSSFDWMVLDFMRAAIVTGDVPSFVHDMVAPGIAQIDSAQMLQTSEMTMRVLVRKDFEAYYFGDGDFGEFNPQPLTRSWCYRHLRWLPGVKAFARNDILRRMRQSTAIIVDAGLPWHERYVNLIERKPFDTEWVSFEDFEAVQQSKSWLQRRIDRLAEAHQGLEGTSWWVRRTFTEDGAIHSSPLKIQDLYPLFYHPEKSTPRGGLLGYHDSTSDVLSFEVRLRATRLAMLVDFYRREHGRLPETLDALDAEAVSAIGGDPYNGKPFGYEIVERGFIVYSVGEDLVEGGAEHLGDQVVKFAADPPPVPREGRGDASGTAIRGVFGGLVGKRPGLFEKEPEVETVAPHP